MAPCLFTIALWLPILIGAVALGNREMRESKVPRCSLPIGRLAEDTGVKVETIRYYERINLLPRPTRSGGNQRRYAQGDLKRLAFIKHARDLGFSGEGIRALLRLSESPELACGEAHTVAAGHLAEVRCKIGHLGSLEAELQRIAKACSSGVGVSDCALIEALAGRNFTQG